VKKSRRLVNFSGAPGSGKTSLAVPLAAELGWALLTKDRIKETLHDTLGAPEADLAWSRRLGAAAMELLWVLAADAPAVVIEANFRPYSEYEGPGQGGHDPAGRCDGRGQKDMRALPRMINLR
jgi:adenylylsulfate kinase-like enzyme